MDTPPRHFYSQSFIDERLCELKVENLLYQEKKSILEFSDAQFSDFLIDLRMEKIYANLVDEYVNISVILQKYQNSIGKLSIINDMIYIFKHPHGKRHII